MRIAAVGDVTAFHREPESGYEFAGPVLATAMQGLDTRFDTDGDRVIVSGA